MWLLVLIVVAASVYFFLSRKDAPKPVKTKRQNLKPNAGNPFKAISIVCGEYACAAANINSQKRFLLTEVPNLPLSGCAEGRCGCRYQHHTDRRSGDGDRRLNFGLSQELHGSTSQERRQRNDRRKACVQ